LSRGLDIQGIVSAFLEFDTQSSGIICQKKVR